MEKEPRMGDGEFPVSEVSIQRESEESSIGEEKKIFIRPSNIHPILNRDQQTQIFDYMKHDASLADLLQDTTFLASFSSKDRESLTEIAVKSGSIEALFIACNTRLIYAVANRYRYNLPLSDALNAGGIGLIHAARKWEPERGFMFSSYAVWHVRSEIQNAVAHHLGIRRSLWERVGDVGRIKTAFTHLFGREPSDGELRNQLLANTKLSPQNVDTLMGALRKIRYTSQPVYTDSSAPLDQFLVDSTVDIAEEATERVMQEALSGVMHGVLARLTEQEQVIIKQLYGVDGVPQLNIGDIAQAVGISVGAVEQICLNAFMIMQSDYQLRLFISKEAHAPEELSTHEEKSIDISEVEILIAGRSLKDKIKILVSAGINNNIKIGKMIGRSRERVRQLRNELVAEGELETREAINAAKVSPEREQVRTLRNTGLFYAEIAATLGIPVDRVIKYARSLIAAGELESIQAKTKRIKAEAVSDATEQVRRYIETHFASDTQTGLAKIFKKPSQRKRRKQ